MHALISYLIKLSISLAVVWLFYHFVLRKLTFYNSNRWYLLFFTTLSFCIPVISISFIENNNETGQSFIQLIPSVQQYTVALEEASVCPEPIWSTQYDKWDWMAFAILAGAAILFIRFVIRYLSFVRIRSKAELISDDGVKIYQVNDSIIPFSFGDAVFINCSQHSSEELVEIVRHEFVHVRQKHTIDIIWAELLCILNWYNPFAWLLKKSIRQNLEFIADNKVIENGINKKQYQYLLLKVIGDNQYSIATQFNFSSLKKRIAMMNKTKSTRKQVARFLFLLPVLAVILLSFRKTFSDTPQTGDNKPVFTDTIPEVKEPNSKGYLIDVKDKNGECLLVIRDKNKKEVTRMLLSDWNKKADYYENLYGEIPPAPAKPAEVPLPPPLPAKPGEAVPLPRIPVKAAKPGEPALPKTPPAPPAKVIGVKPKENVKADFDLDGNSITVMPKNGVNEVYDLDNAKQKKQFSEKYGDPVLVSDISTSANINSNMIAVPVIATTVNPGVVSVNNLNTVTVANTTVSPAVVTSNLKNAKLNTTVAVPAVVNLNNNLSTTIQPAISTTISANVNVDILITITNTTTEDELGKLITKMKETGYELKFTDKNYNDGILTNIRGTIKHKDNTLNFSATDFSKLIIATYHDGDKTRFRIDIRTKKDKEVI